MAAPTSGKTGQPSESSSGPTSNGSSAGSGSSTDSPFGSIEASFSTLAVSLGTQAVVAMGIVDNPMTGKSEKEMDVARFNIDLLRMLRDKTKGNLNESENKLLNDMIYDLQMKFVQASSGASTTK